MNSAHAVGTREEWIRARKELLAQEKQFTRLRDQLSEQRRALPWVRVERDYTFQDAQGVRSLADLFEGRSQLLVYHFMFAPEWEAGCKSCSFWADSFDDALVHLAHRDVSFAAISRAQIAKLRAYQERMGWRFPWLSSGDSSFNFDYQVSFTAQEVASGRLLYNFGTLRPMMSDMPGFSVFYKDADVIYHTYSCYARGLDMMNVTYQYLDLVPKGRDEGDGIMAWLRRHDEYPR